MVVVLVGGGIPPRSLLHAAPPTGTPVVAQQATPQPSPTIGIVQDMLNMRAGPGTDYSLMYVDDALAVGEQLEVLEESSGTGCDTWFYIRRTNGDEGWVCGDYVRVRGAPTATSMALASPTTAATTATTATTRPTRTATTAAATLTPRPTSTATPLPTVAAITATPTPATTATATATATATTAITDTTSVTDTRTVGVITAYALNVRQGPGTDNRVNLQAVLEHGDEVEILSESDGAGCDQWLEIRLDDGEEGWVCSQFVRIIEGGAGLSAGGAPEPVPDIPALFKPVLQRTRAQIPLLYRFTPQEDDEVTTITPGVIHVRRETDDPLKINILLFDITMPQFDMKPGLGDGWLSGRTRTSQVATQQEALAAVNGDLFAGHGVPQGLTIVDSRVAVPPKHRATLAWTHDREPFIGYFTNSWSWQVSVTAADGRSKNIADYNRLCEWDDICLYNYFAKLAPDYRGDVKVFVSPTGKVTRITQAKQLKIPFGMRVLHGSGDGADWLLEHVEEGDVLDIAIETLHDLDQYEQAISGGPIILQDGRFVQDCMCKLIDCSDVTYDPTLLIQDGDVVDEDVLCEDFDTDWKESHYHWVYMPRTGVGYDRLKQTLIVAVVDGYQRGYSRGIQQEEFADLLREFGAYDAMELDGGGSSTMVLDGEIMNHPSDQTGERYVANALLFYWNELGERD